MLTDELFWLDFTRSDLEVETRTLKPSLILIVAEKAENTQRASQRYVGGFDLNNKVSAFRNST
jgi:hypothetical protein